MSDFVEAFGAQVQAAQEAYRRQVQETQKKKADRQVATTDLLEHAEVRFRGLQRAHPRALKYDQQMGRAGVYEHVQAWSATQPRRSLHVRADQSNGGFWYAWGYDSNTTDWQEVDVTTFRADDLDRLIVLLADQDRWGRGELPPGSAVDTASASASDVG